MLTDLKNKKSLFDTMGTKSMLAGLIMSAVASASGASVQGNPIHLHIAPVLADENGQVKNPNVLWIQETNTFLVGNTESVGKGQLSAGHMSPHQFKQWAQQFFTITALNNRTMPDDNYSLGMVSAIHAAQDHRLMKVGISPSARPVYTPVQGQPYSQAQGGTLQVAGQQQGSFAAASSNVGQGANNSINTGLYGAQFGAQSDPRIYSLFQNRGGWQQTLSHRARVTERDVNVTFDIDRKTNLHPLAMDLILDRILQQDGVKDQISSAIAGTQVIQEPSVEEKIARWNAAIDEVMKKDIGLRVVSIPFFPDSPGRSFKNVVDGMHIEGELAAQIIEASNKNKAFSQLINETRVHSQRNVDQIFNDLSREFSAARGDYNKQGQAFVDAFVECRDSNNCNGDKDLANKIAKDERLSTYFSNNSQQIRTAIDIEMQKLGLTVALFPEKETQQVIAQQAEIASASEESQGVSFAGEVKEGRPTDFSSQVGKGSHLNNLLAERAAPKTTEHTV